MTTKTPIVAMLAILVLGLLTALVPGFVGHVNAVAGPTPLASGWTNDYTGQDECIMGMNWIVDENEYQYYEDLTIDMDVYSIVFLGGDLTLVNCTIFFLGTADNSDGIQLAEGNLTAYNCTFEGKGRQNDTVPDYMWFIEVPAWQAGKADVNATFAGCSFNSTWMNAFAVPAGDANLRFNRGNMSFMWCNIEMPEQFYDNVDNGSAVFVSCASVGNRTIGAGSEIVFMDAHYFSFPGIDTRTINDGSADELAMYIEDAQGGLVLVSNRTVPGGYHLNTTFLGMYTPSLNCYWFLLINATETRVLLDNSTGHEYPLRMVMDIPEDWTDTSKVTYTEYDPQDHLMDKYNEDFNDTVNTFAIGNNEEENYSAIVSTDALVFSLTQFSFPINPSFAQEFGGFADATDRTGFGSGSIHSVLLTANAGDDVTETVGALVDLDGSGSIGQNTISSYNWTIRDADGVLVEYGSGVIYVWDTTGLDAGNYTVRLLVTDDEGALDTDTMIASLAGLPDNESGGTDDDDAVFDWSEDWYQVFTRAFWVNGVWGSLKDFNSWVQDDLLWGPPTWVVFVIYGLLVLFAMEMWTEVKFYSWIKTGAGKIMGKSRQRTSAIKRSYGRKKGGKGRRSN